MTRSTLVEVAVVDAQERRCPREEADGERNSVVGRSVGRERYDGSRRR